MENYKEQYTNKKKETKNWNWNGYVLYAMLVTLDTAHFERSLLNTFASRNAVQIIQEQKYNNRKKRDKEQIPKRKKKIGNNILVGYSLLDTKMRNL